MRSPGRIEACDRSIRRPFTRMHPASAIFRATDLSLASRANQRYLSIRRTSPCFAPPFGMAAALAMPPQQLRDEEAHRLPGSEWSHTFHGRDVYSITAARLASGAITFEEVGPSLRYVTAKVTRAGRSTAVIEGGASRIEIVVPEGVAARITTSSGLSAIDVDTRRFPRTDDGYESPDFATAGPILASKSGKQAVDSSPLQV